MNEIPKEGEANEFLAHFYDWAREQGIDTDTVQFKFNAATILTVIQSILHEKG